MNDDYVKFIRYAQLLIENTSNGILAYICPHGFLNNPTFRAMRYNLLQTFEKIYIINLHGNINRGEKCPDGSKDENVFDIEQGVSINIFFKKTTKNVCPTIYYSDLYGLRNIKYTFLQTSNINNIVWEKIEINSPYYLFIPNKMSESNNYWEWINVDELFAKNSTGIVTMGDEFIIADTKKEIEFRITDFISTDYTTSSFKNKYNLGKNYPDFAIGNKKLVKYNKEHIIKICYRPFDNKYTYYDRLLLWRARDEVSPLFSMGDNIGLITARSNKADDCSHFFISDCMSEAKCGERTTQSAIFPLFTYSNNFIENNKVRIPNLNSKIVSSISALLKLPLVEHNTDKSNDGFTPIDLLDYIYAVLYSPKYREKYKEFLKIDFPRVPYPTDKETFWKLVEIGSKLRECHLMHTEFDIQPYNLVGYGTNEVVKPEYKNGRVYISKTQYFDNVPQAQWEQYIGGYQPLPKWLKDRKKTILSSEDIEHYKKIIAALKLTQELMAEIDNIIDF